MLTNIGRYSLGLNNCKTHAALSQHDEIRDLWLSIASSYAFLLKREKRLDAEAETEDALLKAPSRL
jgi:hypothetical protein